MDALTRIRGDLQEQLINSILEDQYYTFTFIEEYVKGLNDSGLEHLRKFVNGEEED